MENIYDPNSFRTSEHFSTTEYFQKYNDKCSFYFIGGQKNTRKSISMDMGVPEGEYDFDTLDESCRYIYTFIQI